MYDSGMEEMEVLGIFHPLVQDWFRGRFASPTPAQIQGWPAIAAGRHALVAAPTGSGKTLSAFMVLIDRLVRAGLEGHLPETTEVVYVSPLKSLSNDIQKNLLGPMAEIRALAEERGLDLPEIRIGVRTGDTLAGERRKQAKEPPHIWITTPESLYVLLTSQSGRAGLCGVRTIIVDEIHALAGNKRGSHLALSVERLESLAGRKLVRIGLSATQRPIDEVARFLVGCGSIAADGAPDCLIVDAGHKRKLDIHVWTPQQELGPIATHELWGEALDEVARLAESERTTLVFVNTRRLAERVAFQLSQRLGPDQVVAHHGSLSRELRLQAETRLKEADVKACVATASLELGIDIGQIDLVVQIGSARAISTFLQRVGRSGHGVGAVPRAVVFPLTRDDLAECAAVLAGIAAGDLDKLCIPHWPLDVLAQQMVAGCGAEEWSTDQLWDMTRRAYPYRDLPRGEFDKTLGILAEGVSGRTGRATAYLHHDQVNAKLRGRRAARLVAMTNGGAIPENADYDVVIHGTGMRVGTVNEDFAIESMAGDIFQLGNTSWQIVRVESGRVRVEDAGGAPPTIPFWVGEAPGRTAELSTHVSRLREAIGDRLPDRNLAIRFAMETAGLDAPAAEQLVFYIEEGVRVLGAVPTSRRIIAERFFDESGGMQLVIHAPLGSRINRAWGMALRKKFCRAFDFELQAAATDDGVNLSLGPQHSFPLADIFQFVKAKNVEEVLVQAILQSPLFPVRWRHAATRSLFVLRMQGGKKVPPPLQRMRADDLMASVFPAQAGCQDNRQGGDVEVPDHPLVFEAMRDCLTEALDVDGLRRVLQDMESGRIALLARDTPQPSVFAHQLLNAMPYAFLDDAPLEERRARAVALRRALPEQAEDLGKLDADAIAAAAEDAWPTVRDADELHDALLTLGVLPANRAKGAEAVWFAQLQAAGRAHEVAIDDRAVWVAQERMEAVGRAFGLAGDADADPADEARTAIVRGWLECSGPLTVADLMERTCLGEGDVRIALAALEGSGLVLMGRFTADRGEDEACDRRILARIHRATIHRLRREIEPVPTATYLQFLFAWQHAAPGTQVRGPEGLLQVTELLAGYEAAAPTWEQAILPLRVHDYGPSLLDRLALGGEVVWGRFSRRSVAEEELGTDSAVDLKSPPGGAPRRSGVTRAVPIAFGLRADLPWLLAPEPPRDPDLSSVARAILEELDKRGALFVTDLSGQLGVLPAQVEEAMGQLVAAGLVTADGFSALRNLTPRSPEREGRDSRWLRHRKFRAQAGGRWARLQAHPLVESEALEERAAQLLRRYGILVREVLAREPLAPPWRKLLPILRRAEARGEIRGGRFIEGLVGEQFALPEAIDQLRAARKQEPFRVPIRLAASDPLNLSGILTHDPRVPALPGTFVVFRDGRYEPASPPTPRQLSKAVT
jgi:ATP-dependent Lhr-like helicase